MFTVFVIGNIASGKSTACHYLAERGAHLIDLDDLAKSLYEPESEVVSELAEAFGWQVVDGEGGIDTRALAAAAFSSPEETARLNAIVHPRLLKRLGDILLPPFCCVAGNEPELWVVEVSVPAAMRDAFALADDVLAISVPFELRRERALGRGMSAEDFDRRAAAQPSEEELQGMADCVICNTGSYETLCKELDRYLEKRGIELSAPGFDLGTVARG